MPSLAPMVKRVSPAVVNVATRGTIKERPGQRNPLMDDPFFRRFFDIPPDAKPRERQFQSAGSGVIVDAKNGYILTNHHVVENASEITITLLDNRSFSAKVVADEGATLVVTPSATLPKGQSVTWTFHYSGRLESDAGGPVEGLKLAYVGEPISYLLYAGRWFPMTGYMTDRFTSEIHVKAPAGYRVVGSGSTGKPKEVAGGEQLWDFKWDKPGFPGTIIAGKFEAPVSGAAPNIHVYTTAAHKAAASDYAGTTLREFAYYTSTFGIPESTQLNVVELPDDPQGVPAYWAPEIAAIAGSHIGGKNDFRLLANTIAHQWWGSKSARRP